VPTVCRQRIVRAGAEAVGAFLARRATARLLDGALDGLEHACAR
jgi:hypothetical protein